MSQHFVSFKFKGERKYIQGPDIMDAVIALLKQEFVNEEIKDFKYAAHKMLYTNGIVTIDRKPQIDTCSLITFKYKGENYFASVQPDSSAVEGSFPYDETPIVIRSNITDNKICIQYTDLNQFSFSELIVSMNKYFLQKKVTQKGKWIVTKAEYVNISSVSPTNGSMVGLVLIKNLNNKLTKSSILVNEQNVGYLYFSLI